jgi:predicted nucleic acid-binding protein
MHVPLMMFDTNVLFYARDHAAADKKAIAVDWIKQAVENGCFSLPTQVVGEFANVLLKKEKRLTYDGILAEIAGIGPYIIGSTTIDLLIAAVDLQHRTGFQWWDCVILASAIEAECNFLISEDYQHRRQIDGVTVINPFFESYHDVVAAHGKH